MDRESIARRIDSNTVEEVWARGQWDRQLHGLCCFTRRRHQFSIRRGKEGYTKLLFPGCYPLPAALEKYFEEKYFDTTRPRSNNVDGDDHDQPGTSREVSSEPTTENNERQPLLGNRVNDPPCSFCERWGRLSRGCHMIRVCNIFKYFKRSRESDDQ